jgi:hypothetical protein
LFDTNLYIAPELLIAPRTTTDIIEPLGLKMFVVQTVPGLKLRVAVPCPDEPSILATERASIFSKLGKDDSHMSNAEILQRYRRLASLGEELDSLVYRYLPSDKFRSKTAFFDHIFEMNRTSIEAYHGLSTVLVVVYGIQAGMMDSVSTLLTSTHFLNAALENAIDLVNHWNAGVAQPGMVLDTLAEKLSKYVKRIVVCLRKAGFDGGDLFIQLENASGQGLRALLGLGEKPIDLVGVRRIFVGLPEN